MVIIGFLMFWLGFASLYIGVWLHPMLRSTRLGAVGFWLIHFLVGGSLMGWAAPSFGYAQPWQSTATTALLGWAVVLVGLAVALWPKRKVAANA